MSLEEVLFMKSCLEKGGTILEIGAGYGRTCHTILSLFPNIQEYRIVDFQQMLELSSAYLESVSAENYKKIKFISVDSLREEPVDLVINIDSMQEMSPGAVRLYLDYINSNSLNFYCKNTVAKFCPSLCGWEESENSRIALESGLLRDRINIFSPQELDAAKNHFLEIFSPGNHWGIKSHSASLPWSHYYQALFSKNAH